MRAFIRMRIAEAKVNLPWAWFRDYPLALDSEPHIDEGDYWS